MKLHVSILLPLSLFVLPACSDAPPQPPAIGLQVALAPPAAQDNPDGRQCQVQPNGSRSYVIGKADGDHTVEDGKDNVDLSCTIRKSNGQVQVDLFAPNQAVGLPGNFGFNLKATVGSPTDPTQNTGTLGFFDPDAGSLTTPTSPLCTLSPPAAGKPITLEPGALHAAFNCPLLINVGNPGEGCRASGIVAVEYCKTGEEEE